jgi:hypothetical protein
MFAFIDTKNATHIAINIPKEGADKTIPALVGMLERNAVFIHKGYSTLETRAPQMSIQLGDKIALDNSDLELIVLAPSSTEILDESFVHESPEVKISNRKAIETKDAEIQRLRTELAHVKQQLSDLRENIEAAAPEQGF